MGFYGDVPSGNDCYSSLLKPWPSRKFVSFPSYQMVDLFIAMLNYQRVKSVEDGTVECRKVVMFGGLNEAFGQMFMGNSEFS